MKATATQSARTDSARAAWTLCVPEVGAVDRVLIRRAGSSNLVAASPEAKSDGAFHGIAEHVSLRLTGTPPELGLVQTRDRSFCCGAALVFTITSRRQA